MSVVHGWLHIVLLKLLVRYLARYKILLAGVLIFQFASALAALYLPTLNADLIDTGVTAGDVPYIVRTGLWMLLVALGQILAAIIATFCAAVANTTTATSSQSTVCTSCIAGRQSLVIGRRSFVVGSNVHNQERPSLPITGDR